MRLREFINNPEDSSEANGGLPKLWIPHPADRSKAIDVTMDQFSDLLQQSVAQMDAKDAIDQAKGYTDWAYSDDVALDLRNLVSPESIVETIEAILYDSTNSLSRNKLFQGIVDDPAWLRFIIQLEDILLKYARTLYTNLKNEWISPPIEQKREIPRLPAGRTEFDPNADSFIDKMKNIKENLKYNPKTLPNLDFVLETIKELRYLATNFMSLVIDPSLKKLGIESPEINAVFNKHNVRSELNDNYAGKFQKHILGELSYLEKYVKQSLSRQ